MQKMTSEEAMRSLLRRLLNKQRRDGATGCLVFTGALNGDGRGVLEMSGVSYAAHRVAAFFAGIIDSLDDPRMVCHHCDNPPCTEPDHLYAGNAKSNATDMSMRGRWKNQHVGKTHCKNGHALTGYNLMTRTNGTRRCRTCANAENARVRERKRAA